VIKGEIPVGTAILAFVVVTPENVLARQYNSFVGDTDIPGYSDDRWGLIRSVHSMQKNVGNRRNHFSLIQKDKKKCSLHRTNS
jgi:hypothetical protein